MPCPSALLFTFRKYARILPVLVLLFIGSLLPAQNRVAPSTPQVGSANTVTADPSVPRPRTTPCTVQLFSNLDFADFNPKYFTYAPPADCPGPWAKVVLNADWSVDAGRQFDRTAEIWIGGTNVYFGTTAEPSKTVARNWHTESDLTEYSLLFGSDQDGRVDLGNLVNDTYTSHLHGSAYLQLYPRDAAVMSNPADLVLPLAADQTGGTVSLVTSSDQLAKTFTLPTNIERAYLDVFAQSQSQDEFWYTCAPNDVAAELLNCGNTGFREAEVSVDGNPAGVAPIYPWIYTGGIDPYLWRPIPGIQTLNFEPYRVDLTPFAALLSDGNPHTVAISVYNANNYFSATATLLLYLDHGSEQVSGALLQDTVGEPDPSVEENLKVGNVDVKGTVSVTSGRGFIVSGYVNTSHGRVQTDVAQSINFSNWQQYDVYNDGTVYDQKLKQTTSINSTVTIHDGNQIRTDSRVLSWPLTLRYAYNAYPDGSWQQVSKITQGLSRSLIQTLNGNRTFASVLNVSEAPADTYKVDVNGNVTPEGQRNSEHYQYYDSRGACWDRTLQAHAGVLSSTSTTCNSGFGKAR